MMHAEADQSDDEDSTFNSQEKQQTKNWDLFNDIPPTDDSGSSADQYIFDVALKVTKILAYIFTFIVVLGGAAISKGTLLFMTSQLRSNTTIEFCNLTLGRHKQFKATTTDEERIAWMWVIFFSFATPELMTFLRSARICFFKSFDKPTWIEFSIVFVTETLHTIGIALLAFVVFPALDVIEGIMLTNCLCFVPGVIGLYFKNKGEFSSKVEDKKIVIGTLKISVDLLAVICQISGFVLWPILEGPDRLELWLIPVALFCISCGWWENYITLPKSDSSKQFYTLRMFMLRLTDTRYRYYTYIFVSLWKMICFLIAMLLIELIKRGGGTDPVVAMFTNFTAAFNTRYIPVTEIKPLLDNLPNVTQVTDEILVEAWYNAPLWTYGIHCVCAYICYVFAKFACKIKIQVESFAFPLTLTVPIAVTFLIAACGMRNWDPCAFHNTIPDYLFFTMPNLYYLTEFLYKKCIWVWIFWLVSQFWITIHIWNPHVEILSSTDKLFVLPMYNSFVLDQSLAMNRRNDSKKAIRYEDLRSIEEEYEYTEDQALKQQKSPAKNNKDYANTVHSPHVQPMDHITRVFACATMWHETREEMISMITSLLRMDADQAVRRSLQKHLDMVDPNYYEFETNILFDDAFEDEMEERDDGKKYRTGKRIVNQFVKQFITLIEETVKSFHDIPLQNPTVISTPYGGRLVYTLPGKTKILVHLKDKDKIRHRKRWSQVMYMYYLLGHRIMELPIHIDRKAVIAQNTYILAMDGDVDFQPQAVHLLLDLMKKNDTLGSSCGRIHPIGGGGMAWYQTFEYAVGHWLQKATEHVIGCVLCSPGAFSMFRARALMDDGVMKAYTFTAKEPRHYIQYDQGEDRWLCTLLLQQGYRVEYAAASDAYTHCPEGFSEFYNQRRRWVPSTMANIMDLLGSYKKTIKVNDNISLPYIIYQVVLMAGSILGPGTIFLMLVGAFVSAFKISNADSLQWNIIPVLIFLLTCLLFNTNIQLIIAMVISAVYGLVMMAVIVGIVLQIQEDGPLAPASIFLFMFLGEMVIAAIIHPKEINCLPAMLIYYITVPSMYMLLIIYSLFNMDNISWGTRETPQDPNAQKTKKQIELEKKLEMEQKKKAKKNPFISFLQTANKNEQDEGSFEFSLAGLFKCICCVHPKSVDDKQQLSKIAQSLEVMSSKIDALQRTDNKKPNEEEDEDEEKHTNSDREEEDSLEDGIAKLEQDSTINPHWIFSLNLKNPPVHFLHDNEVTFWEGLIKKYLHPIDEDKVAQKKIAKALKELRNKYVFSFCMLNALFVLAIFLLQLNQDTIHIKWPLGAKAAIAYNRTSNEVHITKSYLTLEPVGIVFVLFFAIILVIQFIGMIIHRFSTLSHMLASTTLSWGKNTGGFEDGKITPEFVREALKLTRQADRFKNKSRIAPQRRSTVANLVKNARKKTFSNIEEVLLHNIDHAHKGGVAKKLSAHRTTLMAMKERRSTVLQKRRESQRLSQHSSSITSVGTPLKYSNSPVHSPTKKSYDNPAFETNEAAL